jgi:Peptidase family M23
MPMGSAPPPTVARMRPITLICALAATLQLCCSNATASGGWTWPIRGPVLTPYRNGGDPYAAGQHRGIDIGAPAGSRVVAAAGGTITFAGMVGSSGLTVSERTSDARFDLSYLHLSSIAVHKGDALAAGAVVGAVGVSGRRSVVAPHLHFGVRDAGTRDGYHDPLDFLAPPPADRIPRRVPSPLPVAHPAAPAHGRVRGRRPRLVPGRHPFGAPHPRAVPASMPRPFAATHPHHASRPRHVTHPGHLPDPLRGPTAAPTPATPHGPATAATPHPAHGGGMNVGWLLACLGLITAATVLGQPDATRKLAARGRTRVTALLRPASRAR